MGDHDEVSVRSLLEIMDLGHLSEEFEAHGIGTAEFLNLSAAAIRMVLPQPKYPFVLVLKFLDNYTELLEKSGCVLHPSLVVSSDDPAEPTDLSRIHDASVTKVSQKSDKEIEDNGSPRHDANPYSRGKDGVSPEEHITISESDQEASSKEWLKRNYEPFDQVKFHWGRCMSPRVKELILARLTPASYVAKWSDLLKLPDGYQLANSRDFLILQILPDICKLNCWVKLGKARIKPSSVESRNAFILHVTCTYKDCLVLQKQFDKANSFRKHLKSHKSCNNVVPSNISSVGYNTESESYEDCNHEPNLEPKRPCSEVKNLPTDSSLFDDAVTNSVIALIATMYDIGLTETQVQAMVDSNRQLIRGPFLTILKKNVLHIIQNEKFKVPVKNSQNIWRMFDSITNMFDGFGTTYKRHKEFENCGSFIPPEPFVIGQSLMEKYVNTNLVMEPTTLTGQFIPTRKVLKGFLELPGVLSTIPKYMEKLESDTSGRVENIVQGELWRDKIKPKFPGKIVIPVVFMFDDYESGKSLGSHAGLYNLGAGYVRLPSLPPQFQGALENIFLSVLFHTCDKYFGNDKLFRKVIAELKFLEEEGIYVVSPEGTFHVFFALCICGGDNKGANEILGLAGSFSANFYCRICSIHKLVAAKAVCSDASLIRTPASYENELQTNNLTLTGRKGECFFNELDSFHVYENIHLDCMHDLDEGCWKYLLRDLVKYFLAKGRFTLKYLNECIQGFYFGPNEERNRPPLKEPDHIKNDSTVKGFASERR
ncbi:hypothetical protein FOCC_FOCC015282, partial [Frankliniella occidentalis]